MMYYRYTNQDSPMSDWGHAMLSDDMYSVDHYGEREFTYDGTNAVSIEDLEDIIIAKWENTIELGTAPTDYEHLTADEVFESFNPADIVNSAEAWDAPELFTWFWENVAEENDIVAVLTEDGAVVFDESLLVEVV